MSFGNRAPVIVVVGTGMMGHGIALDFARNGFQVRLLGRNQESLKKGLDAIKGDLTRIRALGLASALADETSLSNIEFVSADQPGQVERTLSDSTFVVEAIVENLAQKQEWFRKMDQFCPPEAILTSTTGSILPSLLASVTKRPGRVLVAHYINPPYLQPLVEVVKHATTDPSTVIATVELLKASKKYPVVIEKEIEGFVLNRIQVAMVRECLSLVEQGVVDAAGVDTIVRQTLGRRLAAIGPLEAVELGMGWDLALTVASVIMPKLNSNGEVALMRKLVDEKKLGLKSGQGLYKWSPEKADELRANLGKSASALANILDGTSKKS
ncbi:MAG: 3-hydroxyacyl-CoA dehydrogenase family protein [Bdellovibrionales bacterium]|nr:3-hydroxyacyl-CoA dehydrogenase family protein [Bdellovibrionales bacterium]